MVLLIDDDLAVRTSLSLLLSGNSYEVRDTPDPVEAMNIIKRDKPALVILDLNFSIDTSGEEGLALLAEIRSSGSTSPVILLTGWGSIELAVKGMRLGASDFITKPWSNDHLLQSVRTCLDLSEKKPSGQSRRQLDQEYDFAHIVGDDPALLRILETIGRVAPTNASVLVMGESGTGKELIAEAIHRNSERRNKPFIKVNLGGIATSLFESELFGHVRGAFTDARFDRAGRFELAGKGTIFLDEIGDLDPGSQVKLLRVLQDRTYEVLGSSRTKTVDVRVVCATNKDLNEQVARGNFREDLLYRINLITVRLPSLRERPKDIPLLANFFIANLKEIYQRPSLKISQNALSWLQRLPLPGNIRQLKNLVERAVLVSRNNVLEIPDLESQLDLSPVRTGTLALPGVGSITLEEMEVAMITRAMEYHRNKVSRAAQSLGLTRSSLYRRLDKFGIPYDEAEE